MSTKKLLALVIGFSLTLFACNFEKQDIVAYDWPFAVWVFDVSDDIGGDLASGPGEIDVVLRPDGLVDIVPTKLPFPKGVHKLSSIPLSGSQIKHAGKILEYDYKIDGNISQNEIVLRVGFTGYAGKKRSFTLRGIPRPLASEEELDGYYLLMVRDYGCSDVETNPKWTWPVIGNVRDYGENTLSVVLDNKLRFDMSRPIGFEVNHDGLASIMGDYAFEFTGIKIKGTFSPGKVLMIVDLGWSDARTCPQRLVISGYKMIPSAVNVAGVYSSSYSLKDTCSGVEISGHENMAVLLYESGSLRVSDESGVIVLNQVADTYWKFEESDYNLTYDFHFSPPNARYEISGVDENASCAFEFNSLARKRFLPQNWRN